MKDEKVYLHHILDAINRIYKYTDSLTFDKFFKNSLVRDAVVRNIEIIGEASKNLSTQFKSSHEHIPWKSIAGMRDKAIHLYAAVDYRLVWETIQKDLPELESELSKILKSLESK